MFYVFIIYPTHVTFPTHLTLLYFITYVILINSVWKFWGWGWKIRTDGHLNKTLPLWISFLQVMQIIHKYCSPTDVLKIETWWVGVSTTLAERFHTPCCRIQPEQSIVISCSRRLINVTLKANETPFRAGSIQQTPGCFVHGTVYNTVPAFVTSFTLALQSTCWFTQPFLSIRLSFVTIRGHNVTRRQHDLYRKCVSKIMLMYRQTIRLLRTWSLGCDAVESGINLRKFRWNLLLASSKDGRSEVLRSVRNSLLP